MAYRSEKEEKGVEALVIDGWENGIADSPFEGIGNIRNVNIKYYPKVSYVNYKRQPSTMLQGTFTFTGSLTTGATSGTLTAVWPLPTGTYKITFSNTDIRNATFTNGSLTVAWVAAGGLSSNATATINVSTISQTGMGVPAYSCQSPGGFNYIIDTNGIVWKQSSAGSTTFTFLQGSPTTGANGSGIAFWMGYLVVFRSGNIDFCGDGSGDGAVISSNWNTSAINTPVGNISTMTLTGAINIGDTSASITSYVDAGGTLRNDAIWHGLSGTYQLTLSSGTKIPVALEESSGSILFLSPSPNSSTTTVTLQILITGNQHMAFVSANDGSLYFCNGNNVGSLIATPGVLANVGQNTSFNVSYSAIVIPIYDTVNWLSEIIGTLVIGGNYHLYPWDFLSEHYQSPVPVPEQVYKMINILNDIYLFAGNKGQIYWTNGYTISVRQKVPDFLAGNNVDPQMIWGGIMSQRRDLYFQLFITDNQGTAISNMIYKYDTDKRTLICESENSFGPTPTLNYSSSGVLFREMTQSVSSTYTNYYSAWYNNSIGNIDFNDTTLWSSNEPLIETDIIPIGTAVNPRTFSSAEFKLDQPMRSGDSITLYARQSLSDTYVSLGTTTGSVLSAFLQPIGFEKWQWIQFKVTMSCNAIATSSSFVRLREIRIR